MNKKQFVINMTSNMLAFALNIVMSFFLTPYLIRVLGKEAYSFYPLANNFVECANILAIAFNSVASRFIAIEIHRGNNEKATHYFNSILFSNIIMGLICLLASTLMIYKLENLIQIPGNLTGDVKLLFALVFLNFIINLSSVAIGICTTVRNRLELTSIRKMESTVIKMVVTVGMLMLFTPRISYIGFGAVVATIFVLITNIIYTKKLLPEIRISPKLYRWKYAKRVIFSGMWNSIEKLGEMAFSGLNLLLTNIFLGASAAGNLSIAKTIPSFILSLITTVVQVFIPTILKTYATGKKEDMIDVLRTSSAVMTVVINIPLALFIAFGQDFYNLWVPGEDTTLIQIYTIILLLPVLFNTSVSCVRNAFIAMDKLKVPSIVLCGAGVLNVVLAVVALKLFPQIGVLGIIGISSGIRLIYNIVFTIIYASRTMSVKKRVFYAMVARAIAVSIVIVAIGLLARNLIAITSWIALFAECASVCLVGGGICIFVLFGKKDRQKLLSFAKRKLNRRRAK